ncbi:c-type cytochrome [Rhodospirillum centenum]|nr:cytochrome c [Rhodospirillum centenum]
MTRARPFPLAVPFLTSLLLVAPLLPAAPADAADRPADARIGGELAQSRCTACHVVAATGGGTDQAPALPAVAVARSDGELAAFLARPHGAMPPISLTRQEIADLVAYLGTLRPPPP